jgi:hypothetical protein
MEEGAVVLVAKGEVGRGEGGERRGIAGLRGVEELLLQRTPLAARVASTSIAAAIIVSVTLVWNKR